VLSALCDGRSGAPRHARGRQARAAVQRTAYNFVSLAHDDATVDRTVAILEEALREI